MLADAPCRADLAGGTLDIWPLGLLHPGAVTVSAAIPVRVTVVVDLAAPNDEVWHAVGDGEWRRLDRTQLDLTDVVCRAVRRDGGVRVRSLSQPPVGSGLGGSSAYGVAVARAIAELDGRELDDEALVAVVRDLEARVLGVPTGTQDHWAAVRGGVLALHQEPGCPRLEPLTVDPAWLTARLTVCFTGITHHSGMVNWHVIRRRLDGDRATIAAMQRIAEAATECRRALLAAEDGAVADAIADEWRARRRLAPEVAPDDLLQLIDALASAGATAVKACGAGGGGSVAVWHPPDRRDDVEAALAEAAPGGSVLARGITTQGLRVE